MENFSLFPRSVHIYRNVHVGGRHYPYWHCFLTHGAFINAPRPYRRTVAWQDLTWHGMAWHGMARRIPFLSRIRARVKSRLMSRMGRISAADNTSAVPSHKETRFFRVHREERLRNEFRVNDRLIRAHLDTRFSSSIYCPVNEGCTSLIRSTFALCFGSA